MPNTRIITSVIGRAQRGIGRAQVNIDRASALPGLYKTTPVFAATLVPCCGTRDNYAINPRTAGGAVIRPLRFFTDSEKTATRNSAKFVIAVHPIILHISKKTMIRWLQKSRLQVLSNDLTSSCIFQSLRACQKHIKDPNSLKLAVCNTDIRVGIYDLYTLDFLYRWPRINVISMTLPCQR